MKPTETLVIRFESDHHRNLHRVMLDAGFTFQVTSDLQIGRRYLHPTKPIEVVLEDGDDDAPWFQCKVFYRGHVQTDQDYSKAEWDWLSEGPDTQQTTVQMLQRELHILINIRPRYLSVAAITATGL